MAIDENKTKVTILTDTYRFKGNIELLPGARITDYMTEAKEFIAVTDAEVWEVVGRQVFTAPFVNVNRDHIQIISPGNKSHCCASKRNNIELSKILKAKS